MVSVVEDDPWWKTLQSDLPKNKTFISNSKGVYLI